MLLRRRTAAAHRGALSLLVFAAVLGGGASLALRSPSYSATSEIVVTPMTADEVPVGLPVFRDLGDPIRTIETAAALLHTRAAATRAADRLGGKWTGDSVFNAVSVRPQGQTNLVDVVATTSHANDAAAVANAYTAAILEERRQALSGSAAAAAQAAVQQLREAAAAGTSAEAARSRLLTLQRLETDPDPSAALAQQAVAPTGSSSLPAAAVMGLALAAGLLALVAVLVLLRDTRPERTAEGREGERRSPGPRPLQYQNSRGVERQTSELA